MVSNEERKRLTFEQAEGAEALPSQLQLKTLSRPLRVALWNLLHLYIEAGIVSATQNRLFFKDNGPWKAILYDEFKFRQHMPADEFGILANTHIERLKIIILTFDYIQVFGILTFILRHNKRPIYLGQQIDAIFKLHMAAYRIWDGDTIVPFGSEAEQQAITSALADTAKPEFAGARTHLKEAAKLLSEGAFAGSIRESIHAVEAIARYLEPTTTTLGPALTKLEKSGRIHPAMRTGFNALYGYTSDEQGIRHALVDFGQANADETDAMYMFGTCAAFVSYLIRKSES